MRPSVETNVTRISFVRCISLSNSFSTCLKEENKNQTPISQPIKCLQKQNCPPKQQTAMPYLSSENSTVSCVIFQIIQQDFNKYVLTIHSRHLHKPHEDTVTEKETFKKILCYIFHFLFRFVKCSCVFHRSVETGELSRSKPLQQSKYSRFPELKELL